MFAKSDLKGITGLTSSEVAERLRTEGHNELPSAKPRSVFHIAAEVVREPMFLLLLGCGGIYLTLGEIRDAIILMSFVLGIMAITFFQERKTERALEALKDLSSPRALVIRDGQQQRIAGRDVVRGDLVILSEGDRVPADGILMGCLSLTVDESLLTGEAVPVRKAVANSVEEAEPGRPGGDDLPWVYSGTLVVQGQGVARVTATGPRTEIGRIGQSLKSLDPERTALQKDVGRLVRNLALLGLVLCLVVVVAYGTTQESWVSGLLAGLTLAMAMVPEEFPVVLTIFLALGAWRMSRYQVLTRKTPTVETLGSATVLCVDKTGTLTQNHMSIAQLCVNGECYDLMARSEEPLPEMYHEIAEFGILASQRDPFDPMEIAFKEVGDRHLLHTHHLHHDWSLIREYPLSAELLAVSHVWRSPEGTDYVVAVKGAPEAVADLCHLGPEESEQMARHVMEMANSGLRVLGVAKATFREETLPEGPHDFDFEFIGLAGLLDPVGPLVPDAVRECYQAGVRVIMITGDYPGTASAIARQIGLRNPEVAVTGPELDRMDDEELQRQIQTVNIFARAVPEQKLRLVQALKANGEMVAMTGDGVNDAPALKAAHIGVAMGGRGTDVAREAADLVILDDDFSSIVTSVRMGRRILDNLQKAMAYILAVHVPIAGMTLLPVLLKLPLVLLPVHVVFMEMIIDPSCTIVFEAETGEDDLMRRPPRKPGQPLFNAGMITWSVLQGLSVLAMTLVVFLWTLRTGKGEDGARTLAFTTLIASNLALILSNRSWTHSAVASLKRPNTALWWVVGGALVFLALSLSVPFMQTLFHFAPVRPWDVIVCAALGGVSLLWFEVSKVVLARRKG